MLVSGTYEGDIVRPLGLVTLYSGYAELEIDSLLESLSVLKKSSETKHARTVGQKLTEAGRIIDGLSSEELAELRGKLDEAGVLFDKRNALVHNAIFSGASVVQSRASGREQAVTPDALMTLARQILSVKEHINANRQRILEPMLAVVHGKEDS